jgi:hypothetical protein
VEEEVTRHEHWLPPLRCDQTVSFLLPLIPTIGFLFSDVSRALWVTVLEEQLMASCREVERAHPQEGPSGESRHHGAVPRARLGLASMDDQATTAEADMAIMKMKGSLRRCD